MRFLFFAAGTLLFLLAPLYAGAQSLQKADSLRLLGEEYHESGKYREAEDHYRQAFHLYEQLQDTVDWMTTGQYYAEVLGYQSKFEQAFDLFDRLKNISHPAIGARFKARTEHDLAWLYKRQGKLQEALDHYRTGLTLSSEARDSLMIAYSLLGMGGVYTNQNNYAEALDYRKRALPYFEGLGNKRGLAMTLNNIGYYYKSLHISDRALQYFSKSLEIGLQLNDINLLSSVYSNLGSLYHDMGNFNQALVAYKKSLDLKKQSGNRFSLAITLNNIGVLYSLLGDTEKALEYYREHLSLYRDIAPPRNLAITYSNLGNKLWELGEHEAALEHYKKALALRKRLESLNETAKSLLDLAKIEHKANNYGQAFNYIRRAVQIADSTGDQQLWIDSQIWLGLIYRDQGDLKKAIDHFKKVHSKLDILTKHKQLSLLIHLAHTYDKMGSDSALTYGQQAINIIEESRSDALAIPELRISYFKQYSDLYTNMASWVLKYEHDLEKAYRFVEAGKARVLTEELAQAARRMDKHLPEENRIQRARMLNRIDDLRLQLDSLASRETYLAVENELRQAELDYATFLVKMAQQYPGLKQFEAPEPLTLAEAQATCEPETAVLEYAVTSDYLVTFFISNNEVSARQVHLQNMPEGSSRQLTELVRAFKEAIRSKSSVYELRARSKPLYDLLVRPFDEHLQARSNLIIVPDGALAYLPFEALTTEDGSYMIQNHNVKYVPSLTSLTLLNEPADDYERQMLAVAGSWQPAGSAAPAPERNTLFAPLPAALVEVDSVASHYDRITKLKNEKLSEATLKRLMGDEFRFIHLATHGVINEVHPAKSGLLVSEKEQDSLLLQDDGMLRSSEIYRLNIPAEMVVLSACNTGLGKVVKGEGMLGLQRSFFYAGVSTVVASLWNVYDRSTAFMMNEFYKSILKRENEDSSWYSTLARWTGWDTSVPFGVKAKAMRDTKLTLLNHERFSHPVYWAPFIVVGR